MWRRSISLLLPVLVLCLVAPQLVLCESGEGGEVEGGSSQQSPLVMVSILARNTAHTLPNVLGSLEHMDYPKHRMKIW